MKSNSRRESTELKWCQSDDNEIWEIMSAECCVTVDFLSASIFFITRITVTRTFCSLAFFRPTQWGDEETRQNRTGLALAASLLLNPAPCQGTTAVLIQPWRRWAAAAATAASSQKISWQTASCTNWRIVHSGNENASTLLLVYLSVYSLPLAVSLGHLLPRTIWMSCRRISRSSWQISTLPVCFRPRMWWTISWETSPITSNRHLRATYPSCLLQQSSKTHDS